MTKPSGFTRFCCVVAAWFFWGSLLGLAAYFALPEASGENREGSGCYTGGTFVAVIECRGFFGASLLNILIGIPFGFLMLTFLLIASTFVFVVEFSPRDLSSLDPIAILVVLGLYSLPLWVLFVGIRAWWRLFWSAWRGEDWPGETEAGKLPDATSESSSGSEAGR